VPDQLSLRQLPPSDNAACAADQQRTMHVAGIVADRLQQLYLTIIGAFW